MLTNYLNRAKRALGVNFADGVLGDLMVGRKVKGRGRVEGSSRDSRRKSVDRDERRGSCLGMPTHQLEREVKSYLICSEGRDSTLYTANFTSPQCLMSVAGWYEQCVFVSPRCRWGGLCIISGVQCVVKPDIPRTRVASGSLNPVK